MEPNLNDLHLHPHRHVSSHPAYLIHTNGLISPPSTSAANDSDGGNRLLFSPPRMPSAAAAAPSAIPARKRGRPRKYGTPEQALAARKAGATVSPTLKERKEKALLQQQKRQSVVGNSDNGGGDGKRGYLSENSMTQFSSTGDAGRGFIPHVIAVAVGDDVAQKVMEFTQQSKREICILSASGSISTVSLRQPATTGGMISYGGQFEIITLSGSYLQTSLGGRTGGLSICLSSPDGQIIGGSVGGPLMAAGPVQVILGSFIFDMKKDHSTTITDMVSSKLPPPIPSADGGEPFMVYPRSHATNSWLED